MSSKRKEIVTREKILEIRRKSQKKITGILRKVGFVTPEIRKFILKRDKNKCITCKTKDNLTIDHVISISKGGLTNYNNLQVLCRSCNSKKQ